jgi:hypothetical protein
MNTVLKGSIYSISSSSNLFQTLLQGWKQNMSTPGSKLIQARIDWTERNNLLPILVLGVKSNRIRYAAHGGSEDIQYINVDEFTKDEGIQLLDCKNNDDVNEWRIKNDVSPQSEAPKVKKAKENKEPKQPKEKVVKEETITTVLETKEQIEAKEQIETKNEFKKAAFEVNPDAWEPIPEDQIQRYLDEIKAAQEKYNTRKI